MSGPGMGVAACALALLRRVRCGAEVLALGCGCAEEGGEGVQVMWPTSSAVSSTHAPLVPHWQLHAQRARGWSS